MGLHGIDTDVRNPYAAGQPGAYGRTQNRESGWAKTFSEKSTEKTGNAHLTLHWFDNEDGEKAVGAWGDAVAGTSVSVYQPKDFDINNPVYKVKIWDSEGNVTEKMVDISELDPANADDTEMYAYACHLSSTGKYPSAQQDFMMTHAMSHDESYSREDLLDKKDWFKILADIIKTRYEIGDREGYFRYRNFLDAIRK